MLMSRFLTLGRPLIASLVLYATLPVDAASAREPNGETSNVSTVRDPLGKEVDRFYGTRANSPLWLGDPQRQAAVHLLRLLATAHADGLDGRQFPVDSLKEILEPHGGRGDTMAADRELSLAFVRYAQALQRDPKVGVIYVDPELKPKVSSAIELLTAAGAAPSLTQFVQQIGWMHPFYAGLRDALVSRRSSSDEAELKRIALNLERVRALPRVVDRYVLVNTADQLLTMYDGEKRVGQMKVVAGRTNAQTPLINAFIRYAVLNPYWNVPSDLAAKLAKNVIRDGPSYLKEKGYEVVSDLGPNFQVVDPSTVDWKGVATGRVAVQLRQLPGPANSMGRVKYMFPNTQGVWLHDTPTREHFGKDERLISSGCVRLQEAWTLGAWLFDRSLKPTGQQAERRVDLARPVPIFITYLTVLPESGSLRILPDVYERDTPALRLPSDVSTPPSK